MLIGGSVNVPDGCGDFCPDVKSGASKRADMSSRCCRCPIFNCTKVLNDIYGCTPLIKPENFSPSIAQSYVNWWGEAQLLEEEEY